MKKIIMLILLTTSIFAFGTLIPEQAKNESQVICKEGYVFLVVTIHNGNGVSVSVTQIMQGAKYWSDNPQPMKCKK